MTEKVVTIIVLAGWVPMGLLVSYVALRLMIRRGEINLNSKRSGEDAAWAVIAITMFWPVAIVGVAVWQVAKRVAAAAAHDEQE
jgi:hypothetical protein